jgi:tripartite motif-containing protein 71
MFVKKWGTLGIGDGQFHTPYGIDVDSTGNVWVADRNNARIQKFDKNGNFLLKFGSLGAEEGQFVDPEHLAIDSNGYVYVSDRGNNNIQVFKSVDDIYTGKK